MSRSLLTCAVLIGGPFLAVGCGINIPAPSTAGNDGAPAAPQAPGGASAPASMPMGGAGGGAAMGNPAGGANMANMAAMSSASGGQHGAEMMDDPTAGAGNYGGYDGGADPTADVDLNAAGDAGYDPAMERDPTIAGGGAIPGDAGYDPAMELDPTVAGGGFPNGAGAADRQQRERMARELAQGAGAGGPPGFDREAMERQRNAEGLPAGAGAGFEGAEYGGEGGRGGGQFEEGSAERAVSDFVAAVNAGDLETAGQMVGPRATGQLAAIRDGRINDTQLQQLQTYFSSLDHIGGRVLGRTVQSNFNGGSNKLLLFEAMKEREGFVVTKLTIRDAPPQRGTSSRSRRR